MRQRLSRCELGHKVSVPINIIIVSLTSLSPPPRPHLRPSRRPVTCSPQLSMRHRLGLHAHCFTQSGLTQEHSHLLCCGPREQLAVLLTNYSRRAGEHLLAEGIPRSTNSQSWIPIQYRAIYALTRPVVVARPRCTSPSTSPCRHLNGSLHGRDPSGCRPCRRRHIDGGL